MALCLPAWVAAADLPAHPESSRIARLEAPSNASLEPTVLDASLGDPLAASVTDGSLDGHFEPFKAAGLHFTKAPLWLRLAAPARLPTATDVIPVLLVGAGMDRTTEAFARRPGKSIAPNAATVVPQLGGAQDTAFVLPSDLDPGQPFCARVGRATSDLHFMISTLDHTLAQAQVHARMIALAFGA